jgi:hypothetical protein
VPAHLPPTLTLRLCKIIWKHQTIDGHVEVTYDEISDPQYKPIVFSKSELNFKLIHDESQITLPSVVWKLGKKQTVGGIVLTHPLGGKVYFHMVFDPPCTFEAHSPIEFSFPNQNEVSVTVKSLSKWNAYLKDVPKYKEAVEQLGDPFSLEGGLTLPPMSEIEHEAWLASKAHSEYLKLKADKAANKKLAEKLAKKKFSDLIWPVPGEESKSEKSAIPKHIEQLKSDPSLLQKLLKELKTSQDAENLKKLPVYKAAMELGEKADADDLDSIAKLKQKLGEKVPVLPALNWASVMYVRLCSSLWQDASGKWQFIEVEDPLYKPRTMAYSAISKGETLSFKPLFKLPKFSWGLLAGPSFKLEGVVVTDADENVYAYGTCALGDLCLAVNEMIGLSKVGYSLNAVPFVASVASYDPPPGSFPIVPLESVKSAKPGIGADKEGASKIYLDLESTSDLKPFAEFLNLPTFKNGFFNSISEEVAKPKKKIDWKMAVSALCPRCSAQQVLDIGKSESGILACRECKRAMRFGQLVFGKIESILHLAGTHTGSQGHPVTIEMVPFTFGPEEQFTPFTARIALRNTASASLNAHDPGLIGRTISFPCKPHGDLLGELRGKTAAYRSIKEGHLIWVHFTKFNKTIEAPTKAGMDAWNTVFEQMSLTMEKSLKDATKKLSDKLSTLNKNLPAYESDIAICALKLSFSPKVLPSPSGFHNTTFLLKFSAKSIVAFLTHYGIFDAKEQVEDMWEAALKEGNLQSPDFTFLNADGNKVSLSDLVKSYVFGALHDKGIHPTQSTAKFGVKVIVLPVGG